MMTMRMMPEGCGGVSASNVPTEDAELLALCDIHRRDHQLWVTQMNEWFKDDQDEAVESSDLETSWKLALSGIALLCPKTIAGAQAKLEAAQRHAAWVIDGELDAADLFASSKEAYLEIRFPQVSKELRMLSGDPAH